MSRRNTYFIPQTRTPRTIAFLAATGISDATIISALNTMDLALIANGLDGKFQALYPFVGGTSTTHKFNFMNALDTNAAFRLSFSGGWTHSANGAQPNGTTGYADTFFIPNTNFASANSSHLSFYSRTAVSATHRDLGCYFLGSNPCMCIGSNAGPTIVSDNYDFNHRIGAAITNTQGLLINTRTGASVHKAFRNATQIGSTDVLAAGSMPTISLYLGAANLFSSGTAFSTKQYSFASIGTGLSDADVTALYSIIQTFQTTLGRNV